MKEDVTKAAGTLARLKWNSLSPEQKKAHMDKMIKAAAAARNLKKYEIHSRHKTKSEESD